MISSISKKIKPLLQSKCFACHSGLKQEAGLRLDARQLMEAGGDSGPILGTAAESLLVERIAAADDWRMPPPEEGAALRAEEIEDIRGWLDAGAPAPDEPVPELPENHWAFQPVAVESVLEQTSQWLASPSMQAAGIVHPVDALVERLRAEHSLRPSRPVSRNLLIRRLYLDLIGLPPSPEQLEDPRDLGAIADELLASPQYGVRWGRHWMDLWRYSDWYGLGEQLRNSQKHLWRWRDWIIDSLNADKGYDRMILEMLAGDELAPDDPDVVVGTGFLARNYYLFNRTTWLDDTVEHTGKAFLGLTLNCAKCHDHKYDPISHIDYYGWRAFFEPHQIRLDPVPSAQDLDADGLPRAFDDDLTVQTWLHQRGDPARPDMETPIAPRVPGIFAATQPVIEPISLPVAAYAPGTRPEVRHGRLQAALNRVEVARDQLLVAESSQDANQTEKASEPASETALQLAEARLSAAQRALEALQATIAADDIRFGLTEGDLQQASRQAWLAQHAQRLAEARVGLLEAGDDPAKQKKATDAIAALEQQMLDQNATQSEYSSLKVSRKALETPEHTDHDYPAAYSPTSSGRRLALARWIASSQNPLTARVAVNHIWLRHFGEPLVENVLDFGLRTPRPLQTELLDYLAAELIQSGWSMKHLHRLLVTSQLYSLGDAHACDDEHTRQFDPENHYWWRGNVRRVESQAIRDCLLQLAGWLDPSLGGPPQELGPDSRRRSVYFKHSRDEQDQFLTMFDDADILQCYRRAESIVPQQPLALANSRLALDASQAIAQRISAGLTDTQEPTEFIQTAFLAILARPATAEEARLCQEAMNDWITHPEAPSDQSQRQQRARERLIHSLINHNDFISIR
jgi:hypothetical protein